MDLFLSVVSGLLIGGVLGGLGGGGAILTVPALVYVIGEPAQDATTASLVIVGLSALVGVTSYVAGRRVRWLTALVFGAVGLPTAWLGTVLNHRVDEDVLMLGFAVFMVAAAVGMTGRRGSSASGRVREGSTVAASTPGGSSLSKANKGVAAVIGGEGGRRPAVTATSVRTPPATSQRTSQRPRLAVVAPTALVLGLLTGFFGVGGGFVIVPALVLFVRLPMRQAVGTSLLIVAFNSATSLGSRAGTAHFDWAVIVPFTIAATVATLLGKRVADRLPHHRLTRGFAILLALVAIFTGTESVLGLI